MNQVEFDKQFSVKYWMDNLNGKSGPHTTKYIFKRNFKKYCEWIEKTPDQLVEERKQHLKDDDKRVNHLAEMDVKRFLAHLEDKGLSPNTVRGYFMAIRNFYQRNYLELSFFRGDIRFTHTVQEGTRAANKDDIRKMLEVSNPRVRAIILFLKDTGLSESDFAKLKMKDLGVKTVPEIFTLETPVPIITRRIKTKRLTITFIGQESLKALINTLKLRQIGDPELRRVKKEKKGLKPEILTLESPLFRSHAKIFMGKDKIKHLSGKAIGEIIRLAAKKADIWKKGFSAHALRRFFQTNLESAGVPRNWIQKMMGHALSGSEGSYSLPEVDTLRVAYDKAYPHLAITEKAEQKSRVETLEKQVESLMMNGKQKDLRIKQLESVSANIDISDIEAKMRDVARELVLKMMKEKGITDTSISVNGKQVKQKERRVENV